MTESIVEKIVIYRNGTFQMICIQITKTNFLYLKIFYMTSFKVELILSMINQVTDKLLFWDLLIAILI